MTRRHRELIGLMGALSDEDLATTVLGSPARSMRNVVAHVVGSSSR